MQDLVRLDLDVRRLALRSTKRLVDHDARVGQRVALALRSGSQQERSHRGGEADADGRDVRADEAHGVEDGHAGGDGASGAVDVHGDVGLFWLERFFFFGRRRGFERCLFSLAALSLFEFPIRFLLFPPFFPHLPRCVQVQQLRHHQIGHVVVHGPAQPHDALREQLRDDLLEPLDDDRVGRGGALLGDDELGEVAGSFCGMLRGQGRSRVSGWSVGSGSGRGGVRRGRSRERE